MGEPWEGQGMGQLLKRQPVESACSGRPRIAEIEPLNRWDHKLNWAYWLFPGSQARQAMCRTVLQLLFPLFPSHLLKKEPRLVGKEERGWT